MATKGVTWHKKSGKWRASMKYNDVQYHFGVFDDKDDAIRVYVERSTRILALPKKPKFKQTLFWFDVRHGRIDILSPSNRKGVDIGRHDGTGYKRTYVNRKITKANHRMIYEFANSVIPEGMQIDHINGVRDDNRLCNLRMVTNAENMQNLKRAHIDNKTGVKGVSMVKGKYKAAIGINYKSIKLGTFNTIADAENAYNNAASIHHKYNPSGELV